MRRPRLTDRILAGLIEATGETLAGAGDDGRTPAEARALRDADRWARLLREFREAAKAARRARRRP